MCEKNLRAILVLVTQEEGRYIGRERFFKSNMKLMQTENHINSRY